MRKQAYSPILFIAFMLLLALYFDYPAQWDYTPRSTHQWRQADGASIALNYYQNGMDFFEPRIHHVLSGGGHTVGEFPGLYYITAIFYKIFGVHEGIFRLLNLVIFVWGLWCLKKLVYGLTKDLFYSFLIPLFVFSSPVIAYYAFNYVPNTPALGLVMAAGWYFYKYSKSGKGSQLWGSMLLFLLAGLLKPTMLVIFFGLFGIYLIERVLKIDFGKDGPLVRAGWKALPAFAIVMIGVAAWMGWARFYNESHHTGYFLAHVKPIWSIEEWQRTAVYNQVINFWSWAYYHRLVFYATGVLAAVVLFFPKRLPRSIYLLNILTLLGVTAIVLLWYPQFEHHDYYFIELLVYPILVWLSAVMIGMNLLPKVTRHWGFKLLITAFLIYNLNHAKIQMDIRYNPEGIFMSYFNSSYYKTDELQSFLKGLGLQYPARVISIPDQSPCNTLYHLNLMGWTELFMPVPLTAKKIQELAKSGASHLIIGDASYLELEDLKPVLKKPVGTFDNSIFVFEL